MRFPEFTEEWETKKLGEISSVSSGGTPSRANPLYWDGDIPWISTTLIDFNLIEKSEEYITQEGLENSSAKLFPIGTLLMAMYGQGKTRGKVAILNIEATTNQACGAIITNEEVLNSFFAFQNLVKRYDEIRDLSNQGSQENLSGGIIKGIKITFPKLSEQIKITSFLSLIDERIQTQNKIIEQLETLIKNVSEKIFSQNIKFKKIEEKWEVKTLGEILIEINERTINSNQYRILSSTAKGLFYQSDYFNKEVASNDNAGYKILKINQLVFSPQNLWLGNINVNTTYEIGIVSPSYKVFSFNEKAIVGYCKYFLKSSKMMFEYEQCSEQGASIVRRNLNMELFLNIPILLPKLEEQIQISSFLTKIDQKIQTEKAILKQLEMQKKYLLQQMFV